MGAVVIAVVIAGRGAVLGAVVIVVVIAGRGMETAAVIAGRGVPTVSSASSSSSCRTCGHVIVSTSPDPSSGFALRSCGRTG